MRAGLGDCAPSGRLRLDALARWLQDVAYGDVEDAGLADAAVWVVRRSRMRINRWPRFAERMVVRTFCSGIGRMWAERRTTVTLLGDDPATTAAGPAAVEAVALWVHLDPQSWHPATLTQREIEIYGGTGSGRKVPSRLRHPKPNAVTGEFEWIFRAADLDVADHVNNAAYWAPLEQELITADPIDPAVPFDVEIEFRTPAQPGPKRIVSDGPLRPGARRWLLDPPEDAVLASLVLNAAGSA